MIPAVFAAFLQRHRLPEAYLQKAHRHFAPLLDQICQRHQPGNPLLVGINGCQGSGKSTLADYLQVCLTTNQNLRVCNLSLDDFYLTKAEREKLAEDIHPLLAVRGVPGTHDIHLALDILHTLKTGTGGTITLPRFDKARDDRKPATECDSQVLPVDIILFEGWCVGATAQNEAALENPVNPLEATEDSDGRWRHYVNRQLAEHYQTLFAQIDMMVMLKAPGFHCVERWRNEQEQKLAKMLHEEKQKQKVHHGNDQLAQGHNRAPDGLMDEAAIARFIQFYQRITEHLLVTLPEQTDQLFLLDEQREIINAKHGNTNTTGSTA